MSLFFVDTKAVSAFEKVFYWTLSLRLYLQESLLPHDYVRLLQCSWTLYAAAADEQKRVDGRLTKRLHMSAFFFDRFVCVPIRLQCKQLCNYLTMLYDTITADGQLVEMWPSKDSKVNDRVAINLMPDGSSIVKFYAPNWLDCVDQVITIRNLQTEAEADCVKRSLSALCDSLQRRGLLLENGTVTLTNKEFWIACFTKRMHFCNSIHRQYLTTIGSRPADVWDKFVAKQK